MAKKSSKRGRVTPKGTQPSSTSKAAPKATPAIDHRIVNRFDPAAHQRGGGPANPTRAGHHRGNR
jgi:hypothetical protein